MWPDVRRTVNCNRTGTAEVKFQLIFSGSGLTMTEMAHRVCVLLSFISFTESPDFSRMIYLAASVPSFFFFFFSEIFCYLFREFFPYLFLFSFQKSYLIHFRRWQIYVQKTFFHAFSGYEFRTASNAFFQSGRQKGIFRSGNSASGRFFHGRSDRGRKS